MPGVMASLMLMIIALIWTRPLAIAPAEIGILAGFGVIFYAASLTIAIGSKYIAPGEAGLLRVVETPSAILLALLILHEVPGVNTLIGGSIILAAVLFHHMHTHTRRR
jgi:drug/metabolite transporter (DMT)-like permease